MNFFIPTASLGNSVSMATIGRTGEIMGFFYPRIDYAQNIREGMHALRLLEPGDRESFLWCFFDCWRVAQSFEPSSNVLITRLDHNELELNIELCDTVPPGEKALFRRITVNKGPNVGPVQFTHYFRIAVGDIATRNAVQYYAEHNTVVQHLRDIALGVTASEPFAAHCSSWIADGEPPTKHAMRMGEFGHFVQSIGRVNFAIGFEPIREAKWQATMILSGADSITGVLDYGQKLRKLPFDEAVRRSNERVQDELSDAGPCTVPEITDAYNRAVISLHDLFDSDQGTFIAASEFDPGFELSGGYGYCWPRDAVICALTAQHIGRPEIARQFFDWTARTQLPDGHWYQRYWADGSPGPSWCVLPGQIQLDQTCAMLHAAGLYARGLGNEGQEFIQAYRPTAEKAARGILDYVDTQTHLHKPAHDLWENSIGSFAYTQAGVIAALKEADEVFGIEPERTGADFRQAMRAQLIARFWQPDRQRWLRRISPEGHEDGTLDSSAMGIIEPWNILDLHNPDDRKLAEATLDGIGQDLRSEVKGGGAILRFQGESYMGGGPGCVNTLWMALCRMRLALSADSEEECRRQREAAMGELGIVLANTSPTGQLPELIPKIMFDYWAAPHAWASSLLIEVVLAMRALDRDESNVFDARRAHIRRRAPSR